MESILWGAELVAGAVILAVGASVVRMWFAVNATRNQARNLLASIRRIHAEALALPASLPKTFPAETQYVPLYELPPELQRTISGHFRSLERENGEVL